MLKDVSRSEHAGSKGTCRWTGSARSSRTSIWSISVYNEKEIIDYLSEGTHVTKAHMWKGGGDASEENIATSAPGNDGKPDGAAVSVGALKCSVGKWIVHWRVDDVVSALIWIQQDYIVTRQTAIGNRFCQFPFCPSIAASMCCSLFAHIYILLLSYKYLYLKHTVYTGLLDLL